MMNLLVQGGPVVVLLLVLSVFALTIIIAKSIQFAGLRIGSDNRARDALELWSRGQRREALDSLQKIRRQPTAKVLEVAMQGVLAGDNELAVGEEVTRFARDQIDGLRAWLRPLEVISNISPLLGLFGTVLGMIEAFRNLEQAGNNVDPSILSGGIWQALLTTAVGLAVAIPATLAHAWFDQRVENTAHRMEDSATRVFNSVTKTKAMS